jgi:hypothetical protein
MSTTSALIEKRGSTAENADLTVADAVWVGTALLHQRHNNSEPLSTADIVHFVESQRLTKGAFKSIWQHVSQHCVANRPPQPNRACMLFATGQGNRRLFRDGDRVDPERVGGRTHPNWDELPSQFADLRQWYETVWNTHDPQDDPLLAVIGTGREIWADQHADEYIAELRNWRME